jgi:Tfp pilus assembly protein PilP
MAIQIQHNHEIGDDFVNELRNTYTRDKSDEIAICDKSETAIAYALNEIGDAESSQFVQHLRSCRDCLALVFDVRLSSEEAAGQTKNSAKLDTEISATPETSGALEPVQARINRSRSMGSRLISYFLSPKLIAGLAACCIIFYIVTTFPVEKNTGEATDVIRKKIALVSTPKKPATKIFKLRVTQDASKPVVSKVKPGRKLKSPLISPLEKTALKDIKLMGVMLSESGNIAIIKDAKEKEYIISEGARIGVNSGRVIQILDQKIIVEEQLRDTNGYLIKIKKELILQGERKS